LRTRVDVDVQMYSNRSQKIGVKSVEGH
jgi:hypothetical protein